MEEGCSKRINLNIYKQPTKKYCLLTKIPKENLDDRNSPFSFGMCSHPNASESKCPIAHPERQWGADTDDEVKYLWD